MHNGEIKVINLTKKFGTLIAVDNISFTVEKGEIFGLLGPNGAGKTTTTSMLSTILEPTSGEGFVGGFSIVSNKKEVRKLIGIVFQDPSLDLELTAYDNMKFHALIYGVPKEVREKRIIELLELVELKERKNDLVGTFSGGMKRRLELARGLLHEPKVLFLDEPTLGLDPQTRNHIWEYIKKLNKEKEITIMLTTHYMEEADKLCNRVGIMDKGKIVALDTPKNLKNEIGEDVVVIESPESEKILNILKTIPYVRDVQAKNDSITINLQNAEEHIPEIFNLLYVYKFSVNSFSVHNPTLEDVFLHYTGKYIRDNTSSFEGRFSYYLRKKAMS